jgi:hypothetical protein
MEIIREAFEKLYPGRQLEKEAELKYSGRFKPYNANVRITPHSLEFKFSKTWKGVNREIQIGLIQSLLKKVYKTDNTTLQMDLYNLYVKSLEKVAPKDSYDPILAQSFSRVNEKYFMGLLDLPNLVWGSATVAKLGTYEYHTDTITISSILLSEKREALDYVMYHEMLHKKHKFHTSGGRSYHHTKLFREKEKAFENPNIEEKLKRFLMLKRRRRAPMSKGRVKAGTLKKWIERFF